MSKNIKNPIQAATPENVQEAILTIQIITSFKKHHLNILKDNDSIDIRHKHDKYLYLIFYLVFLILPLVLFKDNIAKLYPTLLLYFFFIFLLIWNIVSSAFSLKINLVNKTVIIKNADIIGNLLHPKKKLNFEDIDTFIADFEQGKFGATGKNKIILKTKSGKEKKLFKINSDGAGLTNGRLLCNSLNIICTP